MLRLVRSFWSLVLVLLLASTSTASAVEKSLEREKLLQENVFGLGEVKVSGARMGTRLSDAIATDVPHNLTVIGEKEIEETGLRSTPELIARKEGIFYTDFLGQGLGASIDLRGFGGEAKQALVVFDGMRATEPYDNSTTWHLYPHEYLDRIEIQRGGGSTIYGEGALSGVIRMKTKGPTKKLKITTENAWGDFGTERYFVDVSGTHDKLGFYAGGRYILTDGYRARSNHEGGSTLLKAQHEPTDRVRIGNSFYYVDHRTDIAGPLSQIEVDRDRRLADPDGQPGDHFSDQLVQNGIEAVYTNEDLGLEIANLATFRRRNQDSVQSFGGFFAGTNFSDVETIGYADIVQGTWALENDWIKSRTTTGFEWSKDDVFNPGDFVTTAGAHFASLGAVDRQMLGAFAQHHLTLWNRAIVEYGARWDDIRYEIDRFGLDEVEKTTDRISPQIGFEYRIFDALSVYTSYGETLKGPDVTSLVAQAPNLFTPNPGIEPQVARHTEIGVRYAHPTFGSVRADVFHIETKKEIIFNATSFQSENFDTIRAGFEIAQELAITEHIDIFANYVYTNPEFDHGPFDGKTLPLTPESRWNAGFTLEPLKRLRISLYGGGTYDQFALNNFQNTVRADDYWTLGGRLEYGRGPWTVFLNLQNILGEEYASVVSTNGAGTVVNFQPSPTSYIEGGFRIEL